MKAYEVTLRIIDLDELGPAEISAVLENTRYPNHSLSPTVAEIREAEIGEWSDDHPLNKKTTADAEWERLFRSTEEPNQ